MAAVRLPWHGQRRRWEQGRVVAAQVEPTRSVLGSHRLAAHVMAAFAPAYTNDDAYLTLVSRPSRRAIVVPAGGVVVLVAGVVLLAARGGPVTAEAAVYLPLCALLLLTVGRYQVWKETNGASADALQLSGYARHPDRPTGRGMDLLLEVLLEHGMQQRHLCLTVAGDAPPRLVAHYRRAGFRPLGDPAARPLRMHRPPGP